MLKILRICLLCAALFAIGCAGGGGPKVDALTVTENIAERAPGSLPLDVTEYSWVYINDNAHIRIKGKIMNTSGAAVQAITLHGVLYDQNGRQTAAGSSYIAPTYLKPGGVGEFEILTVATRKSGVKNTRLVTNCQARGY